MEVSLSKAIVENIARTMQGRTFHHHYHLLYDLRTLLGPGKKTYTEIGTFHGGSACLMMQHPFDTEIHCIDPFTVGTDQYQLFQANVKTFNLFQRTVTTHKRFSNDREWISELHRSNFRTDILFIDGDHSSAMVQSDFALFHCFLNPGGFLIFDDYQDYQYSPEVKPAVDLIVRQIAQFQMPYEIIGSVTQEAYSVVPMNGRSNEFVLQKCIAPSTGIEFAICMATYHRSNGKSRAHLERVLSALREQTYQNFKLFLVGDKYENRAEFDEMVNLMPAAQICAQNLEVAWERENITRAEVRWAVGGVNAMNTATRAAYAAGYKYILHADDDDYWDITRLEVLNTTIQRFPDAMFYYNYSTFPGGNLPREVLDQTQLFYNNLPPRPCNLVHATYCCNYTMMEQFEMQTFDRQNPEAINGVWCGDVQKIHKICSMLQRYPFMYTLFIPMLLTFKETEGES